MASNDRDRFDDSEDEEDFNPAPADLSEDEGNDGSSRARDSSPNHRQEADDDDEPVPSRSRRAHDEDEDEEEDEEEEEDTRRRHDDDDEEEEDEDEDDEDVQQGHRRKRQRDRRNAFIDIEAEVDDEDEGEDEEKDGEEIEDFIIDNAHPDDLAESSRLDDDRRHRELDRRREMESSMDAEKQAEILRQRYGNRRPGKSFGDSAVVPKRLLLPSVDDPSIWAVRCKEGKEREVVMSIMKRVEERRGTKDELAITAAFERGGPDSVMKSFVYVETQRQTDILVALDGILNVYPHSKLTLVDIKDMPELLRVTKTPTLEPGAWVRLRRPPKHSGDLAQVIDVTENGLEARVRFIPRLDYGMRDEALSAVTADGKRKRPPGMGPRPPQRLFSEIEARKRHPRHIQGNPTTNTWTYMGDEFENGFQVKDVKIQQLVVTDVNPSLEEVTRFASGADDGTENLDLKALAASLKDSNTLVTYLPGDIIEVYAGEQRGVVGKATNVQGDIVTMFVTEGDLKGQSIEVPIKGLRKRFKIGDHVKVIGGSKFQDEVGTVVKISEDRVTLLTDHTNNEVTVFSKDLREASDIGGQGSLGQYELHDLVQLDPTTVGCIVKVDRESLVVLDQFGDTRQVMPSQIPNKLPKRKQAVAADREGSEIRLDDVVKEFSGQQRQGKIIHIHRSYVFLHTHATNENAGVFVTKASMVNTIAAKGGRVNAAASGPDLTTMNPALKIHKNGTENKPLAKAFGRDRAINQTVIIKKGAYKGLLGIVKDTTDTHARVELHTKNKTITVPRDCLNFKDKNTGMNIDINGRGRPAPGGAGRGSASPSPLSLLARDQVDTALVLADPRQRLVDRTNQRLHKPKSPPPDATPRPAPAMDHPGATISLASITNPRARSRSRDGRFIEEPKQPQRPAYGDSRESSYVYPDDDLRSPRGSGSHLPYPDDDKLKYLPQKYGRGIEDDDLAYGLPPPHSGRHRPSQSVDLRKHSDSDRDDSRSHRRSNTLSVDVAGGRDRSRSRSRDGRSGRDRSPQPPTGRMSTLTVNTGRGASLSLASAPASPLLESYHGTYQNCSPMPSPLLLASKHPSELPRVVDALSPVSDGEDGTRLNRRARFHDAEDIASRLARALKGTHKPDVAPFIEILPSLSHEQVMELRSEYKHIVKTGTDRKGVNIAKHIRARFKDEDPLLMKACYAVALGKWESEAYWANFWYQGDKTRRELLIESLMGRTNEEIRRIKDSFSDKKYDNSLTKCMKTELKEDKFKKAVLMVLDERRMEEYDYEGRRLPLDYKLIDQDVEDLHKAVKSEKGGETMMISIVVQRSDGHLRAVLKEYEHQYRSNFARDALKKSGNLVGELLAHILNGIINRPVRDALLLQHAITASRKDSLRRELLISRLVRFHWDSFHMQDVKRAYRERYGQDLQDAVREATSGEWGLFCRELCIARMPNEIRRMENSR